MTGLRHLLRILLAAVTLSCGTAALADWAGFYRSSTPSAPRAASAGTAPRIDSAAFRSVCVNEILRAQIRHNIPNNLLLGIGLQEAGVSRGGQLTIWPWAVNAAGEGRIFDNREAALDWIRQRQSAGVNSIDVGCMQINLVWHPDAFRDTAQGFDPAVNVDYAARFLKQLHAETGDWTLAAGSYHSRNPATRDVYLASLRRNVAVANQRIDSFRELAADAPARAFSASETVANAAPEPMPEIADAEPRGFWSAALGSENSTGGQRYGIYSAQPLQPVLPHFTQSF